MFTIRCLRVNNKKRPLSTRCKNKVDNNNGLLCKNCYEDAKVSPINILMHNDVTKKLHIPYKNQLLVEVFLGKDAKKPEMKNAKERQIKYNKGIIFEKLFKLKLKELVDFCKALKLNSYNDMKETYKNEYSLKYHMVKAIINKFITNSIL